MASESAADRSLVVKDLALQAGFDVVGIAALECLDDTVEGARFSGWLEGGRHATMGYMHRDPARRLNPGRVLRRARSVVCVGLNYGREPGDEPGEDGRQACGRVARYAHGRDYHKVFTRRLTTLEEDLHRSFSGVHTRRYVDTGPVLEKLWAERAGLGWRGKHTNLVSRGWGSWLLLGEVLMDLELEPDPPESDYCGTCSRCIDVCPTRAITAPYQLDANLCISYLTIEHRGTIPKVLRPLMGDHVFGCDDCLEVCPWNRFARAAREIDFRPRPEVVAPLLTELVEMSDARFLARFAGTAVMRAKRAGLARNACIALGNTGGAGALAALAGALQDDSPLVREHAAWALGRPAVRSSATEPILREALARETDARVRETLGESLG